MLEPRARQRAECRLVVGKVADDVGLGTCVRQDVEEVVDNHRETCVVDALHIVQKLTASLGTHQLVERELYVATRLRDESTQELLLVHILSAILVIVEPLLGHKFIDSQRHKTREERIARILRCCRQNSTVEVVDLRIVISTQQRLDGTPLIVAHIVDKDECCMLRAVDLGQYSAAHKRMRHHGNILICHTAIYPVVIVATYILTKLLICLILLITKHFSNALIRRASKLNLPTHNLAVELSPLRKRRCRLLLCRYAAKLRTVVCCSLLGDELLRVQILLYRQKHLVGIHRFDDIVGNLRADSLIHNVLLLALRNHNYG